MKLSHTVLAIRQRKRDNKQRYVKARDGITVRLTTVQQTLAPNE